MQQYLTTPLGYRGRALPLTDEDLQLAANKLGVETQVIRAILDVEGTGDGGFLPDHRPKILFEAHYFSRRTGHRYDEGYPDISSRKWDSTLYKGGAAEYERLEKARNLNMQAAMESASWGLMQVMGANWRALGYPTVSHFVSMMCDSEGAQLDAGIRFILHNRLDDELRDLRWRDFARGYNGPGQVDYYAEKLAHAYEHVDGPPSQTVYVQTMLHRLGYPVGIIDGITGPQTRRAIREFQADHGLVVDGLAGPRTLAALDEYDVGAGQA
ncbi:MAG: DUF3380 domain-containing protein [Xanthomonadales bacterium]|nr:DUF3380 domain-containing protein [Xanthomonadales bacterium]